MMVCPSDQNIIIALDSSLRTSHYSTQSCCNISRIWEVCIKNHKIVNNKRITIENCKVKQLKSPICSI